MKKISIPFLISLVLAILSTDAVALSENYVKWRTWYEDNMRDLNHIEDLYNQIGFDTSGIQEIKDNIYKTYIRESSRVKNSNQKSKCPWTNGRIEQQKKSDSSDKYTGALIKFGGKNNDCTATWKAYSQKNSRPDGDWKINISMSGNTITVHEHHSNQKWVGKCSTRTQGSVRCSGEEVKKRNFTFSIILSK